MTRGAHLRTALRSARAVGRGLRVGTAGVAFGLMVLGGAAVQAQGIIGGPLNGGVVQTQVLVIDIDTVRAQSAFGQMLRRALDRERAALFAENRSIEAELTDEERQLTEDRDGMATEDFRALAEAFDAKVQRLRDEQRAKAEAFQVREGDYSRLFLSRLQPVLQALMQEAGAAVILDRRSVFAVVDAVDVTGRAVVMLDAQPFEDIDVLQGATPPAPEDDMPEEDTTGGAAQETATPPLEGTDPGIALDPATPEAGSVSGSGSGSNSGSNSGD